MTFAHIGDGAIVGTDQYLQTTLELLEDSADYNSEPVTGSVEFYDDAGEPLAITVNSETNSVFPFELADGELKRFVTSGTGDVKTGWVHVHSSQPIKGALSFGIRDGRGAVVTNVGVAESMAGSEFTIFADSMGPSRTGLAVTNPSDEASVELQIELRDTDGNPIAQRQRSLVPRGHFSVFLDELFQGVTSIDEFEGTAVITALDPGTSPAVQGGEPA